MVDTGSQPDAVVLELRSQLQNIAGQALTADSWARGRGCYAARRFKALCTDSGISISVLALGLQAKSRSWSTYVTVQELVPSAFLFSLSPLQIRQAIDVVNKHRKTLWAHTPRSHTRVRSVWFGVAFSGQLPRTLGRLEVDLNPAREMRVHSAASPAPCLGIPPVLETRVRARSWYISSIVGLRALAEPDGSFLCTTKIAYEAEGLIAVLWSTRSNGSCHRYEADMRLSTLEHRSCRLHYPHACLLLWQWHVKKRRLGSVTRLDKWLEFKLLASGRSTWTKNSGTKIRSQKKSLTGNKNSN